MAQNKVILQAQDVTMQFGGLRAIDSVSFHVDEAEIFGLIGSQRREAKPRCSMSSPPTSKPTSGSVTPRKVAEGARPNRVVNAGSPAPSEHPPRST